MKFPVVTCRKSFPLQFKERLVWSLILWRNRVQKPCSVYFLNSRTGIHRHTIVKLVARLRELGLILVHRSGQMIGIEPEGERRDWFSWKDTGDKWIRRLRYWSFDRVESLPLSVAGVLSVLRADWSWKAKSATKQLNFIHSSARGLANLLGLSVSGIRNAIKRLSRAGLISYTAGPKGYRIDFVKPFEPSEADAKPAIEPELKPKRVKVKIEEITNETEAERNARRRAEEEEKVKSVIGRRTLETACECRFGDMHIGRWTFLGSRSRG